MAALLLAAFAFGGGGSRFGLANLAVQLSACAALAAFPLALQHFVGTAPRILILLIATTLALPLIQLIPLPQSLGAALPGRDLASSARDLAQIDGALTWSLTPWRTALAASALLTPLAVILIGWMLPRQHLFYLGWAVVGLCLVTFMIGAVQVSTGAFLDFWPEGMTPQTLLGTFGNRNSTGLFLLSGIALAACLPVPRPHPAIPFLRLALCALFLTAVVLTKSRTALALSLIPCLLALIYATTAAVRRLNDTARSRPVLIVLAVLGLGISGIALTTTMAPGRVSETLERFENTRDDPRKYFWEDAGYAASRYWPVGAGMGSFDDVFQIDEALENIASSRRAGRAHNDYLEVAIEAGAFGLVLITLWLVYLAWLTWQARRSEDRWAAWAASSFLLAIALQSITDYPLRNQTMLAVAAFALLLLVRIAQPPKGAQR